MKVTVQYNQQLLKDELLISACEQSPSLTRIVDFAEKELFYVIGLREKEKVRIDLKNIQRIYSANKQDFV